MRDCLGLAILDTYQHEERIIAGLMIFTQYEELEDEIFELNNI